MSHLSHLNLNSVLPRIILASLLDSVTPGSHSLLFYVVTPTSILSTSSSSLRQILLSVRRALANRSDHIVKIHYVPDFFVRAEDDASNHASLEAMVFNVYDRVLRPADRLTTRPLNPTDEKLRKWFKAPAYTLARSHTRPVLFSFDQHSAQIEKVDRYVFLHVGYSISKCGKWLFAACIDQRGETHEFDVWLVSEEQGEKSVVERVWKFAIEVTRQANVDWQITFTKVGLMNQDELHGMSSLMHLGSLLN
jgi:mediator of RNA polymerase II transcription subunit 13, fungi type